MILSRQVNFLFLIISVIVIYYIYINFNYSPLFFSISIFLVLLIFTLFYIFNFKFLNNFGIFLVNLGKYIGFFMNPIILGLLHFILIIPMSIIYNIFSLNILKNKKKNKTNWTESSVIKDSFFDMEF